MTLRSYSERIAQIGSPVPMCGVMTLPASVAAKPFGLVILNSGLVHHVGSCCFSVKLARAAAAMGVTALRYDASGIGDSTPRNSAVHYERRAVSELREVLDFLQRTQGIDRFAVMGLCAGAFASFNAAREDKRIIGVVQIAAFAYRTHGWYLRHYGPRLLKARHWHSTARRVLGKPLVRRKGLDEQYLEEANADWALPTKAELEFTYRALLSRRVRLLNIMTGGESDAYLYRGQFRDMFPELLFDEHFEELYYPNSNHITTQPVFQHAILDNIIRWIGQLDDNEVETKSVEN